MVIYRQDWWEWKCWQAPFSGRWCNPSWQTRAFEVGLPRPSSGGRYILKVPHFYQHVQTMKNYDLGNRISISRYLLTELPCCGRGGIEHNEVGFWHIQAHWASWWAEEYSDQIRIEGSLSQQLLPSNASFLPNGAVIEAWGGNYEDTGT